MKRPSRWQRECADHGAAIPRPSCEIDAITGVRRRPTPVRRLRRCHFETRQRIVMAFQFGTNWSALSERTGSIQGPLLGYEVFTAFTLTARKTNYANSATSKVELVTSVSGCETVALEGLDHSMKDQSRAHRGNKAGDARGGIDSPGADTRQHDPCRP